MDIFENLNIEILLENLPGYAYWIDKNNIFLGCNTKQAEIMGLSSRHEITGKKLTDFQTPRNADSILNFNKKVMSSGVPAVVEELLLRKDHNLSCFFRKIPLKNKKNQVIGLLSISQNSELSSKEKCKNMDSIKPDLYKEDYITQVFFKKITESLPQYVFWKDINSVYLGCNKNFAQLLGFKSPREIVGKTDNDLPWQSTGDTAETFRQGDKDTLSGESIVNREEVLALPNGKKLTTIVSKLPIINNGKPIGIVGYFADITELNTLKEAQKAAEAANQAKAEFLRNMEHQLRTPFSGVYSLVQLLSDQESDPEKKQLLEITYSSGKELLDFLNDVISFSRNQVEATAILAKKFDLKQLIEKAITLEKPAAVMKGLNLSFNYPDDLPSIFISDPKRIQRIVLNLLSNAIKFTPKGSVSIAVKLGKKIDDKYYVLRLIFTDTGIGIAEENQSLIYERFYRVSPANQNKYQGTGLGLHIVKELIADLEGEIDLKSQLNEGTTFICTLPLKRPLIDEIITEDETSKRDCFDKFKVNQHH